MENSLFLGVPILKHIRVYDYARPAKSWHKPTETTKRLGTHDNLFQKKKKKKKKKKENQ